jgi:putative sigma-54 modulation protein
MRSSDRLREKLEKKLSKYDKFLDPDTKASATFKTVKNGTKLDLVIYFNKHIIKAEELGDDGTNAIDLVIDKIDVQLKKYKEKLYTRNGESIRYDGIKSTIDQGEAEEFREPKIVKTKLFALKPMSPKEATLQMELLSHSFYVFLNGETEDVNVVYKRKDGDYGLIEPDLIEGEV